MDVMFLLASLHKNLRPDSSTSHDNPYD